MGLSKIKPGYITLHRNGLLKDRAEEALSHLVSCDLCPWECGIDRSVGRLGFCKTSYRARVASYAPHMGEEDPLRGTRGSGTIFLSHCNLRCQYCQNYDISQQPAGRTVDAAELAAIMLSLQAAGCHNINLVSPSHVVAQIIHAISLAAEQGLTLPIVYNTGGYDSLSALRLLDGIVDIYMPDMKYGDSGIALKYSKVKNYVSHNLAAVREMHRQVGDLVLDENGLACRGLLVRHLVLPGGLAGTEKIARFLADEISRDTYINIMGQYRPEYYALSQDMTPLNRAATAEEIRDAYAIARAAGLHRFDERRYLSRFVF